MGRRPHGAFPAMRWHSKGYWFCRATDPTGKRRDYILGADKDEAKRKYEVLKAEFELHHAEQILNRNAPQATETIPTAQIVRPILTTSIDEICVSYLESIRARYEPTNSFLDYKKGCGLVAEMFGRCAVTTFLIPQFDHLIQRMVDNGWAKRTINHRIDAIKQMFKYALMRDVITGEQYAKITSVPRIKTDDPRVKPARIVTPVPVDVVERTLPFFHPLIADIVRVQLKAGMRAAEACRMRYAELHWDADGILWYCPAKHKTASKGKKRNILLGPKSQAILRKYGIEPNTPFPMNREYVFDPRPHNRRMKITGIPYYETDRYTREIRSGVERAIVSGAITTDERWTSHQLRHRAGTDARREYGLDAAQLLLGHSDARTTERYAEPDLSKALDFAKHCG